MPSLDHDDDPRLTPEEEAELVARHAALPPLRMRVDADGPRWARVEHGSWALAVSTDPFVSLTVHLGVLGHRAPGSVSVRDLGASAAETVIALWALVRSGLRDGPTVEQVVDAIERCRRALEAPLLAAGRGIASSRRAPYASPQIVDLGDVLKQPRAT